MSPGQVAAAVDSALENVGQKPDTRTFMSTYRGGFYDLGNPRAEDFNLNEACEIVAGINRFNAASATLWSVGQHLLLCDRLAEALEIEAPHRVYVTLHDLHEAYIGDTTSRQQAAFDWAIRRYLAGDAVFTRARKFLAGRWDDAIYRALGLVAPDDAALAAVKRIDRLALALEACAFFDKPADLGIVDADLDDFPPRAMKLIDTVSATTPSPGRTAEALAAAIRRHAPNPV